MIHCDFWKRQLGAKDVCNCGLCDSIVKLSKLVGKNDLCKENDGEEVLGLRGMQPDTEA